MLCYSYNYSVHFSKILQRYSLCSVELQVPQDYEMISAPQPYPLTNEDWDTKYNISHLKHTQKSKLLKDWKECPMRSSWGLWVCLVWRKGGWEATSLLSPASWGGDAEKRVADLFSLVSSDRTCGNGSELHQRRFRLGIRKYFFTERVAKHWNRLSREVVNAPSLSMFERHLDNAISNML